MQGGAGSISGEGPVADGGSRTVTWTPAEGETVKYIFVDGEPRPDLKDESSVTFDNVNDKHYVTVVFASNPTNIDTDGDGEPDINIDGDGSDSSGSGSAPSAGKASGIMSATGDSTALAVSVLAMLAYTGLVVLFVARRKMNAERKMGKHAR